MRHIKNTIILLFIILIFSCNFLISQSFKLGYIEKVEIVNLYITVTDEKNNFVKGLNKEDFVILEDGKVQEISHFSEENPPLIIILLIDGSGSMLEEIQRNLSKIDIAKMAVLEFITKLRVNDKCGVIAFEDYPYELNKIANDFKEIKKKILFYSASRKNTALYDAIYLATEKLKNYKKERKIIIIISDGIDSTSKITYDEVLEAAIANDISIFGFVTTALLNNNSLRGLAIIEAMAKETGGKIIVPTNLKEIKEKLLLLEEELFNVYSVAYRLNKERKNKNRYHKLKVMLKNHNYKLRYKKGYIEQDI